jgi:hypothetical protein
VHPATMNKLLLQCPTGSYCHICSFLIYMHASCYNFSAIAHLPIRFPQDCRCSCTCASRSNLRVENNMWMLRSRLSVGGRSARQNVGRSARYQRAPALWIFAHCCWAVRSPERSFVCHGVFNSPGDIAFALQLGIIWMGLTLLSR